jgi:hypothetical protein
VSASIQGRAEEPLRATNFCHVSTLRADGSIHTVPVWVDVEDGVPLLKTVRGRVSGLSPDGADAHIDALAQKYMGVREYPLRQPGEERLIVRVKPEHVHTRAP